MSRKDKKAIKLTDLQRKIAQILYSNREGPIPWQDVLKRLAANELDAAPEAMWVLIDVGVAFEFLDSRGTYQLTETGLALMEAGNPVSRAPERKAESGDDETSDGVATFDANPPSKAGRKRRG